MLLIATPAIMPVHAGAGPSQFSHRIAWISFGFVFAIWSAFYAFLDSSPITAALRRPRGWSSGILPGDALDSVDGLDFLYPRPLVRGGGAVLGVLLSPQSLI